MTEPDEERNVVPPVDDEEIDAVEYETPRMVWGMSTHFAGITDRVNPGHFVWMSHRPEAKDAE